MPGIRFRDLVSHLVVSLELAGARVLTRRRDDRPAQLRVITAQATTDCSVYLWTITHGGATRAPTEQRIQMTGVSRIVLQPPRVTVLGGWHPDLEVYAFWDPSRHTAFTPGSPSLQVAVDTLQQAAAAGIATQVRELEHGREVIVAVTPSTVLWYVEHGILIHNVDEEAVYVPELLHATSDAEQTIIEMAETDASTARRRDLVQVMRPYRSARFRANILEVYGHRCAVCGCSLRLVDAAHIIPVSEPDGTDAIPNGIALCRMHHAAYDNALVGILPDFRVAVNEAEAANLHSAGLDHGMSVFRQNLRHTILLPTIQANRPTAPNLRRGLQVREWPQEMVT